MYAIIEEGGGQRKVKKDDVILVDLLDEGASPIGKTIKFDKVLCVGTDGSESAGKIGMPYVAGASVTVEVVETLVMGEKLHIHKFRRRKGYRRKTGHRQTYTKVKVTSIVG